MSHGEWARRCHPLRRWQTPGPGPTAPPPAAPIGTLWICSPLDVRYRPQGTGRLLASPAPPTAPPPIRTSVLDAARVLALATRKPDRQPLPWWRGIPGHQFKVLCCLFQTVGSRTGAPPVGSSESGPTGHVSSPRLVKRSMRISRQGLCGRSRRERSAHSSRVLLHLFQPCPQAFSFTSSVSGPAVHRASASPHRPKQRGRRYGVLPTPRATLSPVSRLPGAPGRPAFLIRRFLAGARRASPVA